MAGTTRCMRCMHKYDTEYGVCPHCGYVKGEDNPLYLPIGTVLDGRYLIGAAIGHGGFGITYAAFDQGLDRKVAIKEYFPSGLSTRTSGSPAVLPFTTRDTESNYRYGREKFIEEAKTLARFSGVDSIISVYTCFTEYNTAYIVMEYLEGEDMISYLKRSGGRIGWDEALALVSPVFYALETIHASDIIHRDVSPDNIFITSSGNTKLLDFGSARFATGEKTNTLSVILKPGYAPPEQYFSKGRQGPWTDIYALGATIYRAVTGSAPADAMERQMGEARNLSAELTNIVPSRARKALLDSLSLDAAKRPQTMQQFRDALYSGWRAPAGGTQDIAIQLQDIRFDGSPLDSEFNDIRLEAAVRSLFPGRGTLYERDMLDITEFAAPELGIKSIDVLYFMKLLQTLDLHGNWIKDIYPLDDMRSLKKLDIGGNLVKDISVLKNLQALEYLDLSENRITEAGPLMGLKNLKHLDLSGNKIKKCEIISWLTQLKHLNLNETGITDISFLEVLTEIEELCLFKNHIREFYALPSLKNLRMLDVSMNQHFDIGMLTELKQLEELYIESLGLYDIEFLRNMKKLIVLSVSNNDISDIDALSLLDGLRELYLSDNNITDCAPLSGLGNLDILDLSSNMISDCNPLSGLFGLTKLDLSNNSVTDISSLAGLTNLKCLYLAGNPIRDFSPVKGFYGSLEEKDF